MYQRQDLGEIDEYSNRCISGSNNRQIRHMMKNNKGQMLKKRDSTSWRILIREPECIQNVS